MTSPGSVPPKTDEAGSSLSLYISPVQGKKFGQSDTLTRLLGQLES